MTINVTFLAQEDNVDDVLSALGGGTASGWEWAVAAAMAAAAILASRIAKIGVGRVLSRRADAAAADLLARLVGYLIAAFGFVYALEHVGIAIAPLLGALGVLGIALAFALREILENFVAGLLIQLRRPFSYGDQITTGEIDGTVRSVDARSVTVHTVDGETVHLPSSMVISDAIINHTHFGRRRSTITIGVAYSSDLDLVCTVFLEAARRTDGVRSHPAPTVRVEGFGDSAIDVNVHFWHAPDFAEKVRVRHEAMLSLNRACRDHAIEIPFPQRVLWHERPGADPHDREHATSEV